MLQAAIEDAMLKIKSNIERHPGLLPHITGSQQYRWGENDDWIEGFYIGMMWLSYQYSGDEAFKRAAESFHENFKHRLQQHIELDHHDLGFLYGLSARAQWDITGDEDARQTALQAASKLRDRWRPAFGAIQAWGKEDDVVNGGRIIIDCLMNLPLLFWAYQQTGEQSYYDIAYSHALKSRRFLVRGDDSSYHTFYFNQTTGDAIRGGTHQGNEDGSTWTRGQAWGVYGFALSYRYTRDSLFLETSKKMAAYFLDHLPEDHVAYWDFDVPFEEDTPRDSSASAIVAAGLLELLQLLPEEDPDRESLQKGLEQSMHSLVTCYSTMNIPDAEGLLQHGSYHVRGGYGLDDYMIWGDYYYLEALVRTTKGIQGYW